MLGDSSSTAPLGSSSGGDGSAPAPELGIGGGGDEFGDRSFGGNRWPRQETIALLKIRSDMDVVFRDASVKGPLWDEVSRKLGELGYQRSAKKCKEKFENVYKYHKRTKEGRTGKPDGKTYRFFDQLAALENHPNSSSNPPFSSPPLPPQPPHQIHPQPPVAAPAVMTSPLPPITITAATATTATATTATTHTNTNNIHNVSVPSSTAAVAMTSNSTSSWSSTDMEEEEEERGTSRKRKWKEFFERLMKEVIGRQEDLQRRFLEAVEKREQERASRDEAWRAQELSRISRERDILSQERSAAAAKDAAVMAFLQKLSSDANTNINTNTINNNNTSNPPPQPTPRVSVPSPKPPPQPQPQPQPQPPPITSAQPLNPVTLPTTTIRETEDHNMTTTTLATVMTTSMVGVGGSGGASSSRWPKTEVHDLIKLRTSLETKYQENGPKGPLWEEISAAMRRMGYNRSAKRCKEKWENINKYFKKVKESNKRRPEDSKTCPYFSMLDAIYRDRLIRSSSDNINSSSVPLMVQPEQQWPPLPPTTTTPSVAPPDDDDDDDDPAGDDDEDDDDDEEAAGNNYELVASKPGSLDGQ